LDCEDSIEPTRADGEIDEAEKGRRVDPKRLLKLRNVAMAAL